MQRTLVVAAEIDPEFARIARADGRFDVRVHPVRSESDLRTIVADAHVLVTRTYNAVTRDVIAAAPFLEVIAQATSGTDNIDAGAASERGITVLSLPGENANAVAEMVLAYILALTRTIPHYTREVTAGRWERDDCSLRHEMRHYRLGILGLGSVGRRVARLARAFGMDVIACDPYISDDDFRQRDARRVHSLADLIAESDVLTMHVPLTSETRGIVDSTAIRSMKRGSILINTARAEVMDQSAALSALADGHLGGLALDVFDVEPPSVKLPDDPRLIVTPHVAGCTHECRNGLSAKLFQKIADFYA